MSKLNILIVDDNQDFAETMADVLKMEGFTVDIAFDGETAIKKFKEYHYDLTFMDVMLPGLNGVESFYELQKLKPDVKVVMMTGYSVEQLLQEAIEHGALEVLYKPIDIPRALDIINKIKPDGMILIADDDSDFVENIKAILEKEGYTIFIAHDGQAAIDRIRNNGIDLLILDLRLPIVNGLEVYLELKKSGHVVPTIIVTAYKEEEGEAIDILKSFKVTGILIKPFEPEDLLRHIRSMLPG